MLCDKSAFNYYKDLAEKGYYNRAISGNVNQRIEVDSIHCNFNTYPYAVTTYAREFIVRQSNVTERSLITTCTLQNSVRSDNNPQGFLMENFLVKENRDIQTYKTIRLWQEKETSYSHVNICAFTYGSAIGVKGSR